MLNAIKKNTLVLVILFGILLCALTLQIFLPSQEMRVKEDEREQSYWFILYRQSQKEELYLGVPGVKDQSTLVKTFTVKTGRPGERPTPLPQLVGRDYWLITQKHAQPDNPETAPYFLTLDVPGIEEPPYGPVPYEECKGEQCDWILPGAFGLHGTAGNPDKLSESDPGSSGCIRHSDSDITYLYHLLDPQKDEIRYYIEDK